MRRAVSASGKSPPFWLLMPTAGYCITLTAGSGNKISLVLYSDYSMIIWFLTLLTPLTSLTYLVARSISAALLALPVM